MCELQQTLPQKLVPHEKLARVKMLTCDVDGVLTDGGLYYGESGERLKRFNVLDGHGLKQLQKEGIKICFISQSTNQSVKSRAQDLGIDFCLIGVEDKLPVLEKAIAEIGIDISDVVHIADDENDLSLLKAVGTAVTVPNGVPRVKAVCRFVTTAQGGHGAVRELCDVILASRALTA